MRIVGKKFPKRLINPKNSNIIPIKTLRSIIKRIPKKKITVPAIRSLLVNKERALLIPMEKQIPARNKVLPIAIKLKYNKKNK